MKQVHMRLWSEGLTLLACAGLCLCASGCARENKPKPAVQVAPAQIGPPPATVRKVDITYSFVVLDFSERAMPPVGSRMTIYRNGVKVGEVQITEPVRAQFATADIVAGDVQLGDEAR